MSKKVQEYLMNWDFKFAKGSFTNHVDSKGEGVVKMYMFVHVGGGGFQKVVHMA